MSVRVTLGNKLYNSEVLLQEANARINELTHLLGEKEEEYKNFNSEKYFLKTENEKFRDLIKNLEIQICNLNQKLDSKSEEIKELHIRLEEMNSNNKELLNVNKNLKIEIENLNSAIEKDQYNKSKFFKDFEETEKMKNKYENSLIEVSQLNDNLNEKIKTYESVLKQKEKYINILLKKNSGSGINGGSQLYLKMNSEVSPTIDNFETLETNSENYKIIHKNLTKKGGLANNNSTSNISNAIINITILQNKISELEKTITQKDEKIKKLEIEKTNLMTRIRNKNSAK